MRAWVWPSAYTALFSAPISSCHVSLRCMACISQGYGQAHTNGWLRSQYGLMSAQRVRVPFSEGLNQGMAGHTASQADSVRSCKRVK